MHNPFNFLDALDLAKETLERLSQLLERTVKGSDNVVLTPLGKNHNPESLLKEWELFLFSKISVDQDRELVDLEKSNGIESGKFGPRSIQKPWKDRIDSVEDYFKPEDGRIPSLTSTVDSSSAYSNRLRPLSLTQAISYLKNSTNSGLPFYVRKGKIKEDLLKNFKTLLSRRDPCILFTRTQEGNKTRNVWGFPVADTVNEMMFYRPLLNYQKSLTWRSALLGPEHVERSVTKAINFAMSKGYSIVSIDFSAYDASITGSLSKLAFDYIRDLFQSEYSTDLEYIEERFKTIGLITPDGVREGEHGVPSGSTFTNEVDSLVQYLLARASASTDMSQCQIQGDDGLYVTPEPRKLIEYFQNFGLAVNEEKSIISADHALYLQNLYHPKYKEADGTIPGIYSTVRGLNRLCYQERFDDFGEYDIDGSDYYALRTLSILENCKKHPLFEDFVKFIWSKDRYGLKTSQKGIDNYVKMIKDKSGSEGIIEHRYGDEVSGIRKFRSFQIVSELNNS
jgi:hypothetical protein